MRASLQGESTSRFPAEVRLPCFHACKGKTVLCSEQVASLPSMRSDTMTEGVLDRAALAVILPKLCPILVWLAAGLLLCVLLVLNSFNTPTADAQQGMAGALELSLGHFKAKPEVTVKFLKHLRSARVDTYTSGVPRMPNRRAPKT